MEASEARSIPVFYYPIEYSYYKVILIYYPTEYYKSHFNLVPNRVFLQVILITTQQKIPMSFLSSTQQSIPINVILI